MEEIYGSSAVFQGVRDRGACAGVSYHTFYNGPDRSEPGLVANGAACGTDKVTLSNTEYAYLYSCTRRLFHVSDTASSCFILKIEGVNW